MTRVSLLAVLLIACTEGGSLGDAGDATPDTGTVRDADPKDADPMDADPTDADPIDADPVDADPVDADPVDADPVDAMPTNDAGRTCATIEAEYQDLVSRTGCQDFMQCKVVNGHCATGLGGCWYTVNVSVNQADLDALATEYADLGCTSSVCRCAAPPAMAICDQNVCAPPP
jgi:hypothetical protein